MFALLERTLKWESLVQDLLLHALGETCPVDYVAAGEDADVLMQNLYGTDWALG